MEDVFRKGTSMVSISHKYQLDQQKVYKLGPYRHALRRRWDGCAVRCATARRRKGYPFSSVDLFLTFTSSKSVILEQDVLRLLEACVSGGCECTGLDMVEFEPKAEKVDKGTTALPRDEYRSEKIRTCLKNSLLVIGVYAPEGFVVGKGQGALSLVSDILKSRSQPRRRLVGFGRAIGDASLVATLHDIMVDPEYRGYGIGRRILLQLANQVSLSCTVLTRAIFSCCMVMLVSHRNTCVVLCCSWTQDGI